MYFNAIDVTSVMLISSTTNAWYFTTLFLFTYLTFETSWLIRQSVLQHPVWHAWFFYSYCANLPKHFRTQLHGLYSYYYMLNYLYSAQHFSRFSFTVGLWSKTKCAFCVCDLLCLPLDRMAHSPFASSWGGVNSELTCVTDVNTKRNRA